MKKRIIVDTSTGCLDYYNHDYDIRIIRLKIDMNNILFKDGEDILAKDFFEQINSDSNLIPKTTQPSIGELMSYFELLANEGYEEAIVTTLSSKLSGTYNGICQVAQILCDKIKIVVFDTLTVCFNEGCFAINAAKMLCENKPTDEIIEALTIMRNNNKIMFAVDNLEYLVKNGRLSGAQGFAGKVLKIKPILEVTSEGNIIAVEKIRTTKKALQGVCSLIKNYIIDKDYFIYIACTGRELIPFLEEALYEECGFENLMICEASPVVGCHVGGNAIGVGIFLKS